MSSFFLDLRIALLSLFEHKRRTLLLGAAVATVTALLVLLNGLSAGIRQTLIETATTISTGHLNVDDFRFEDAPPTSQTVMLGTTHATNAVLERRGALTVLVTTAGFRDVLELRRMRMPHLYDYFWTKPTSPSVNTPGSTCASVDFPGSLWYTTPRPVVSRKQRRPSTLGAHTFPSASRTRTSNGGIARPTEPGWASHS